MTTRSPTTVGVSFGLSAPSLEAPEGLSLAHSSEGALRVGDLVYVSSPTGRVGPRGVIVGFENDIPLVYYNDRSVQPLQPPSGPGPSWELIFAGVNVLGSQVKWVDRGRVLTGKLVAMDRHWFSVQDDIVTYGICTQAPGSRGRGGLAF